MDEKNAENLKERSKMTLKDYYMSLPDATHPKTDFMNEVAREANVSVATVRNWVIYGMKPSNPDNLELLSKKTGIPVDELWKE